nr:hypothetical protein FFPRI1PSEUD_24450 [Pseudomonas sp. FFPRI_1]
MHNLRLFISTLTISISTLACTTQLTEEGRNIKLVTVSSVQGCKILEAFTVKGSSNNDALNQAFNKAAKLGGDSIGIVNMGENFSIQVAALRCTR